MKIVVSIRDDSPMIFCGDSPFYRIVEIELTEEQKKKLKLKKIGTTDNSGDIYEKYSRCYIVW